MRDKLKTENYFLNAIKQFTNGLIVLDGYIKKSTKDDYKQKIKQHILSTNKRIYTCYYSIGYNKDKVKEAVKNTIDAFVDGYIFEKGFLSFDDVIWLLSISILCDIDEEDFKKITDKIKVLNIKDKLVDYLIQYKQPDWQYTSSNLYRKLPYQHLIKALDVKDANAGTKILKEYLEKKWYQGHNKNKTNWINTHLQPDNACNYDGYWAWETAAIVKIKGWDDDTLKGLDYYPYDAVRWE